MSSIEGKIENLLYFILHKLSSDCPFKSTGFTNSTDWQHGGKSKSKRHPVVFTHFGARDALLPRSVSLFSGLGLYLQEIGRKPSDVGCSRVIDNPYQRIGDTFEGGLHDVGAGAALVLLVPALGEAVYHTAASDL